MVERGNLYFKWNVTHLKGEIAIKIKEKWVSLPSYASFFYKLRHKTRFYM
jgi:hypothetical protein